MSAHGCAADCPKNLKNPADYEGARRAMGELWQRVGERPMLEGLDKLTRAEVLLRAGVLTGWIGSAKQIEDAQETAKNLISESITIFEELQNAEKVAEAQTEIAVCYWRRGAFDDARDILHAVLGRLADIDSEVKMVAIIRLSTIAVRLLKGQLRNTATHYASTRMLRPCLNGQPIIRSKEDSTLGLPLCCNSSARPKTVRIT